MQIRREGRNETILEDVYAIRMSFKEKEKEDELVFFTKKGKDVAVKVVKGSDVQDLFTIGLKLGQDLMGTSLFMEEGYLLGSFSQWRGMEIVRRGEQIFVTKEDSVRHCEEIYRIDPEKVELIPHGIPDLPFVDNNYYKPAWSSL